MSFDTGLFIRKAESGEITTGEINLSSAYESEIRVMASAEAALADVEIRHRESCLPYEDLIITGFAPPAPPRLNFAQRLHESLAEIRGGVDAPP